MIDAPTSRKRLLIGACSYADADSALRFADLLAERMAADLGGVLIEAPQGALSSRMVISVSGQMHQSPTPEEAARAAERDAQAFRRQLSMVARTRTVKWSFDRSSGDLVAYLCEAMREWDAVVIGASRLHRAPGRVVWIMPEDRNAAASGRDASVCVAEALGIDILTLSLNSDTGDERFANKAALLARLNRINAAVVVADMAAGPLVGPADLRELLQAARCPVLLFGARQA